ncbi:MAG: UDP-N-acetylglucosamine 1-carboxyvinyltransferase [Anaerovorax sp.]
MSKFLVKNSGPLRGTVQISGAKNAVLPIMAATILTDDKCELSEVPELRDVEVMCGILESIGIEVVTNFSENIIDTKGTGVVAEEIPCELAILMRASILVMGPILARKGRAKISLPGGCAIGARPIELHLKGFKAMGAEITIGDDFVEAKTAGLKGCHIYLDFPSVGATENIIMAATLAEGVTVLENAAQEPEIVDLASFLNKLGAKIKGAGTDTIKIEGVAALHGGKHAIIPDRIEAGTFMVAAAITRGEILIKNVMPDHIRPVIAKLRECGVEVEESDEEVRVKADLEPLVATNIKTLPYPGFPTDMQPQFMALLSTTIGASNVIENVFENRFMHIDELNKMGANIAFDDRVATITPKGALMHAEVRATDLRAGAALVLAALHAEGTTCVSDVYHIERGYENFIQKFAKLGAVIEKVVE